MYPTANRLRKSREIEEVFKRGRYLATPIAIFRFRPNKLPLTRLAIICGTKVHKRATKRNLIKRRLREALRAELPGIKRGFDIVVSARSAALLADFPEIKAEVRTALKRMNLLLPEK
ncbi:ribonuclease P protein component [Candidatus Uhrbacteria bacterium]|nr:ribonuclease P protein component [Candidatus Uhrbacteria bacterium]